ncbi:hypothetical protein MQE23_08705 [Streptomyces sp. HP-A2021]|uniref:hypothetical protein n=1 Tax=Streptomyces sp. HP-A2021 TaxID=2927875 RepID=UPI001FB0026C|nr:hypothetical protein [Streptomyces sp. HP-A2021]UOB09131.1 hypothetical protein MQE23_08705 [Streptomyces sp. HP-A2021]
MGLDLNRRTWSPKDEATTDEKRKASLYVAAVARDAADCTTLLAALGLLPRHHPAVMDLSDHGMKGYRLGCRCHACRRAKRSRDSAQRRAARRNQNTTTEGDQ